MPSRRSRKEKNRAKKIAKLNDSSCADESQEECEERDSFQEAHEKKKARDRSMILRLPNTCLNTHIYFLLRLFSCIKMCETRYN